MKTIINLVTLFFVINVSLQAQSIPRDESVVHKQLHNGLTYYIKQNNLPKNRIELKLVVKVGSLHETKKEQGLAHYLEHMAFNGTKNFEKNKIVSFIESCGMGFGADLNAYTSFTETVYRFTLPADSLEYLNTGLEILKDWSCNITFDPKEIEKEKGVILEEWRLGKGVSDRVMSKTIPVLLANSKYADRLPIGKFKVINKANKRRLTKFYKKWYRPELMAVVVVGTIDPVEVEKKIVSLFNDIPKSKRKRNKEFAKPEIEDSKDVLVVTDEELSAINIETYINTPYVKVNTYESYKGSLKSALLNRLMSNRIADINSKSATPYRYSSAGYSSIISGVNCYNISIGLKYDSLENGILKSRKNLKQVQEHGFTSEEYKIVKQNYNNTLKLMLKNKDVNNSSSLASEYSTNFLTGTSYTTTEEHVSMAHRALKEITLDDLNAIIQHTLCGCGSSILTANTAELKTTSANDSVDQWIHSPLNYKPTPYKFDATNKALLETPPTGGHIVNSRFFESIGVTKWTLNNGVNVFLKKVGKQKDNVTYIGYKRNGISILEDSLVTTGKQMSRFTDKMGYGGFTPQQMTSKLAGKNTYASIYVGENITNLLGYSDKDDLETMFKQFYLQYTHQNRDTALFAKVKTELYDNIKNKSKKPQSIFGDSIKFKVHGENRFTKELTSEDIDKIDIDKVLNLYQNYTEDVNGLNLFFAGDIDTVALKPLVEQYVGALSASSNPTDWKDLGYRYRRGYERFIMKAGKEQKSTVRLTFTGDSDYSIRLQLLNLLACDILETMLTKSLREDNGFTYGAYCSGGIDSYPVPQHYMSIGFGCSPENVDKAISKTWETINSFRSNPLLKDYINKAILKAKRKYEKNIEWHGYWLAYISQLEMFGDGVEQLSKFNQYWDSFSEDEIAKAIEKVFTKKNYLESILLPESF